MIRHCMCPHISLNNETLPTAFFARINYFHGLIRHGFVLTRQLSVTEAPCKSAMEEVLGHLISAKSREEKNNVLHKVLAYHKQLFSINISLS